MRINSFELRVLGFIAVIIVAVVCKNYGGKSAAKSGRINDERGMAHVERSDEGMNAAIAKAKATVGEFVSAFQKNDPEADEFYIKKPYATPTNGSEHMWIKVTAITPEGDFSGIVANNAEETKEVKSGQRVQVKPGEISDWKYQIGKKLTGGYTIRYLVDQVSVSERKEFLAESNLEL